MHSHPVTSLYFHRRGNYISCLESRGESTSPSDERVELSGESRHFAWKWKAREGGRNNQSTTLLGTRLQHHRNCISLRTFIGNIAGAAHLTSSDSIEDCDITARLYLCPSTLWVIGNTSSYSINKKWGLVGSGATAREC